MFECNTRIAASHKLAVVATSEGYETFVLG